MTLAAAIFATSAFASKEAVTVYGEGGAQGGQFDISQGIAVNPTGVGPAEPGDIYVADRNNNRIQRLDSEGNFVSAWGADVSLPDGGTDYEICTEAAECQAAASSGGNTTTAGNGTLNGPRGVAIDLDTGDVYVSDVQNRRINQYEGDGTFVRSFGWSVNETEAGTSYEICPATDVCKVGVASSNPGVGQFHSAGVFDMFAIAVSAPDENPATGKVFLANSGAERIETFNLDGTSPANFGSSAVFATDQPRRIAVDSRGIVYASDSQNNGEIERYDSEDANGGGVGFLAPITAQNSTPSGPLLQGGGSGVVPDRNTADLAVDPDTDGAGPDEDTLYVLRAPASGSVVVQQIGPGSAPGLGAPPGAADDVHGEGAGFPPGGPGTRAIAVDAESERIYVFADGAVDPIGADDRIFVLDEGVLPDPVATIGAITEVTDTTAMVNATVDPVGGLGVNCRYEYSTAPGFGGAIEVNEPACASLDVEAGPQAVSEELTGLDPNEHYFVRIVVTRFFAAASSAIASQTGFDTQAPPPTSTDVGVIQITDTSARMVGTIDPRNSATGYVFEYGTTPALGSSTPPVSIGGGTTPITVSQVVKGLSKDADHYFRLVATNLTGPAASTIKAFHTRAVPVPPVNPGNCPNEGIRVAQGSTHLADCRAYEMVSPRDKNQGGVEQGGDLRQRLVGVSRDGEATAMCTTALFGEPPPEQGFKCAPYVSRRTGDGPTGWATSAPFPRYCVRDIEGSAPGYQKQFLSPDFDRAILQTPETTECPIAALHPAATTGAHNLYVQDLVGGSPKFQLLGPENPGFFSGFILLPATGNDDFSHVLYASEVNQTDPPDSPGTSAPFSRLYQWAQPGPGCTPATPSYDATIGGCLSLISKDASGTPLTVDSGIPARWSSGSSTTLVAHSVSEDGRRVYFASSTEGTFPQMGVCARLGCQLYLRENGLQPQSPLDGEDNCTDPGLACTYHVSAPECTGPCGASTAGNNLSWVSEDGDVALFMGCAKLTDDSAPSSNNCGNSNTWPLTNDDWKLYRWDRDAPPGNRLVDLTIDHEPAGEIGAGINPASLSGGQPHALGLVGASEDADAAPGSDAAPGNTVYFVTAGQIVAGERVENAPSGNRMKLYRWRWNGGDPKVDYLARYAPAPSQADTPPFDAFRDGLIYNSLGTDNNTDRFHDQVTTDGRHLKIQTVLPYDPAADRDGDADIYRWSEAEGWVCISCQLPGLPSVGDADPVLYRLPAIDDPAGYLAPQVTMSDDGKRIFFSTPNALLAADVNGEVACPVVFTTVNSLVGTVRSCQDVYEWNDGTLSLISTGRGDKPAELVGATASGDEVFFMTQGRLLGWDTDLGGDVYSARVGGGFAEPPPAPPECEDEGCRGPATVAPASSSAGAGSAVFQGPGNPKSTARGNRCPGGKLRRGKRCLTVGAIARKRCRRLKGAAKRRCVRKQARRLRRAQRRRAQRRARRANIDRRAAR